METSTVKIKKLIDCITLYLLLHYTIQFYTILDNYQHLNDEVNENFVNVTLTNRYSACQ